MQRKNVRYGVGLGLAAVLCTSFVLSGSVGDARVADAAMRDDKDAVRSLLKQAIDVNAAQGDGMTALHWAALNGDAELAQTLIYAGANVKAMTRIGGYTPLYMASNAGNAGVVDVLLRASADPKVAAVDGLTPLMMAALSGDAKSVQLLVEHGADVNAKEYENGETAMSFAAAFNRPDAIQELLKHGADINLPTKLIEPVSAAAQRGAAVLAAAGQAAPAGAARGSVGRGAAGTAPAAAGAQQQQVVNNGADATGKGGGNPKGFMTPLMYAARQGSLAAAEVLLSSGAKINEKSGDKSTAVLLATINGHFDLAKLLIDHNADVSIASVDGATPLYVVVNTQWARKSFHPQPTTKYERISYLDLMKDLLDHGADPDARLTKELWYSEYNFSLESASAVGTTAFWKCAEVGDIDGMKLLVTRGADPNVTSVGGVNALLMASGAGVHGNDDVTTPYGRMAAVKYLVDELHMDVNAADGVAQAGGSGPAQQQQQGFGGGRAGGGITALHNAAARGDNEMILYLVAHGAKVNVVAKNGQTVVDVANGPRQRIQPYPETIALLEILGAMNSHKCVSC